VEKNPTRLEGSSFDRIVSTAKTLNLTDEAHYLTTQRFERTSEDVKMLFDRLIAGRRKSLPEFSNGPAELHALGIELLNSDDWMEEADLRARLPELPAGIFLVRRSVSSIPVIGEPETGNWREVLIVLKEGKEAIAKVVSETSSSDLRMQTHSSDEIDLTSFELLES
jgi:hypothetical protein